MFSSEFLTHIEDFLVHTQGGLHDIIYCGENLRARKSGHDLPLRLDNVEEH